MNTVLCIMPKAPNPQHPRLDSILSELGENIRLARLRRKLTTTMLAERAGMTRITLSAVERGEPTVSLGAYAKVLFSLGLEKDLTLIARDDTFGRKLQDAGLIQKKNRGSSK